MSAPWRHVTRCLVAGVVALLPIGGTVLGVAYLESTLAESWRDQVSWYFPGLGLLLALLLVYFVGLFVTTFAGKWLWRTLDKLLQRLPLIGTLYQSLKEVLGYDTDRDRFFEEVVAVSVDDGFEIAHERLEGDVLDVPVGKSVPALVVAHELMIPRELGEHVTPDGALPVELQMIQPVRGFDQRRTFADHRVGDTDAVR